MAENNFWQKVADDTMDTIGVKIFLKIALSCTISEILKILHFQYEKNVVFHQLLISQPFCNKSLPKQHTYLPDFM